LTRIPCRILILGMIRGQFLDAATRKELTALMRDGKAESRVTRRANALLLLDDGWSCEKTAEALYMDDDTIRYWHELYQQKGLKWLAEFGYKGRACELTAEQQQALAKWVAETLPRTTSAVGEWIEKTCDISYTRSAIIKLLKRLGMEYRKPKALPRNLDPAKQAAFIKAYNDFLNNLADDEAVMFADAVHPTHAARPAGCWAPKGTKVAIAQTSGRDRLNIHGAIDLETGKTKMLEVLTVNAETTIALLVAIMIMYPTKRLIHVFLDNAKYHHAVMVQEWLKRPDCRIVLHFIPTYCPHLDPIERLWGLMHKNVTHNRCYPTFNDFCDAVLGFLRDTVPKNWRTYCDSVTDNFRIINPADFRVLKA
jgi:transposase